MAAWMAEEGGLAAFGEALRREREERGVTVETICSSTKVPVRHIRALEAGELRELPGGVFRRSFVRSYLGVLGLEEDPWMKRFEQTCQESGLGEPADAEWAEFAENVRNSRGLARRRRGLRWVRRAALLASLALAGWCGWRLATHRSLFPKGVAGARLKSLVDNAPSR